MVAHLYFHNARNSAELFGNRFGKPVIGLLRSAFYLNSND
jgi:hypothetical protein